MAFDGFFAGGVAEGAKTAADIAQADQALRLKRDTLASDNALRTRSLDLEERKLGQNMSIAQKQLALQEQAQNNSNARAMLAQADKQISDTLSIIGETITAAKEQNQDPAKISAAVQPLVESARRIATAGGLNPENVDIKVRAWMGAPTASEKAVTKAKTGIEAATAVSEATGTPLREALQGSGVLKAEPRSDNTMETIRSKIATNGLQSLTPGEKQVYDDAIRSDPLARFLALSQPPPAAAAAPGAPAPAESLPPEAVKQLKEGIVTTFANGQKWMLTGGKPVRVP